jgi:hypothetical protein
MIYRVSIQNFENLRDELVEEIRNGVSDLCDWGHRPYVEGGALELVSEPVTKTTLEWIAEKLLKARVQFTVEDLGKEYRHAVTRAPASYDYRGCAIELFVTKADDGKDERHVAIRAKDWDHQTGRYWSGLYATREVK